MPTPDEIKARIDRTVEAAIAKGDLVGLWSIYYARRVGGETGEQLANQVVERGDQAVRSLLGENGALDYLLKQAQGTSEQLEDVVTAVRKMWPKYDDTERSWLQKNWPDVLPGGPRPAEVAAPELGSSEG